MNTPAPKLKNDSIYLGDNGRAFCGACAGASARYTGHDLSGQPVERVPAHEAHVMRQEHGITIACETCGKESA